LVEFEKLVHLVELNRFRGAYQFEKLVHLVELNWFEGAPKGSLFAPLYMLQPGEVSDHLAIHTTFPPFLVSHISLLQREKMLTELGNLSLPEDDDS
jgi:hypothetical protein